MNRNSDSSILPGSFRDPSGFLFVREGILYRQINLRYKDSYEMFLSSGLYHELIAKKNMIPHEETDIAGERPDIAYKVIQPRLIPFISYPYEWCFSQLKDAALLTLEIQKIALDFGMTLKDASAFNVQFVDGRPVFIDTLSFEPYVLGKPWIAYRQFCRHFLAPLALMSWKDIRLGELTRSNIDGIPLDIASTLLPRRSWLSPGILMHIHLHAKSERKYAVVHKPVQMRDIRRESLLGLLDNLTTTVQKMRWNPTGTEWAGYYQETNYSNEAINDKKRLVKRYLTKLKPENIWDLGANNGLFSRLGSEDGIFTIAFDIDPACVEQNYCEIVRSNERNLLPLLIDLTNPSPGIGWQHDERSSFLSRGPADTVLALALIHHLAISNNVPLERLAFFFSKICKSLIIEFVPKIDSQVQKLLMNREDIFSDYDEEHFERFFSVFFLIEEKGRIASSDRILYLLKKR